ncbi:AAA family ATPase [Halobacillus amylolyticus]|uniref:AAA family ATPase n=1 Tax=Halobacillus amylolyticus TaxID=2932259 RepID=A0ABY4HG52_9BACI|nr:AAA family ATPase [Halobacillus amylolyticus]UOR13724.1 AAA family ATPase [Halobacillus amylolyticus]
MAIYYEVKKGDRKAVYDAAEKWKENCLLNDGSLIWDGEPIWTAHNISRFINIFIESPDESGDSFDDKLRKQLENESEDTYKFVIELLFIYYIYPVRSSTSYETKMRKLEMIASWKDIDFDRSLPIFQGLEQGLGSTGTFFNTSKYFEVSFLVLVVESLKSNQLDERKEIFSDEMKLKAVVDNERQKVGKRVQMQNIILHLLLPNYFERIASWGHKNKIVKAFSNLITDDSIDDTDGQLYVIREKLENKYQAEIDFYHTPSIEGKWRGTKETGEKRPKDNRKANKTEDVIQPATDKTIPTVNFNVDRLEDGLVFENLDILLDQVMTAIRKGKHIILTGPPGTGKSKLASKICEMYDIQPIMVTAASNWSTYETIGGYRPDREGNLYFDDGIFLRCVKDKETNQPDNKWLIIDEINRADIDKAFGSLFSVLTGDEVTLPFESKRGKSIIMKHQGLMTSLEPDDHTYIIPNDWRIIATMNTIDKASLYEMSYAFMRRFAFIPVGIPNHITADLIEQYLKVWEMETYPNVDTLAVIWKLINNYRKIGPAIVEDIARHTQDNDDFTSAIILYVLPQFEGLPVHRIKEFINRLNGETEAVIDQNHLLDFVNDFFDAGGFE